MTALPVAPAGLGEVLARVSTLDTRLRGVDPGWHGLAGQAFGMVLAGGTSDAAGAGSAPSTGAIGPVATGQDALGVASAASAGGVAGAGAPPAPGWTPTGPNLTTISWRSRLTLDPATPTAAPTATPSAVAVPPSGGRATVPGLPEVRPGSLVNPVPGARVSLPFGPTSFAMEPPATINGIHYAHYHDGLDLAAPLGTPVLAAATGTVISAGRQSDGAVVVRIRHADGSQTVYGHLAPDLLVSAGDAVVAGQPIGAIGLTGRTTGPHLHLEYIVDGVNVDPATAFTREGAA